MNIVADPRLRNDDKFLRRKPVVHYVKDFNEDAGKLAAASLSEAIEAGQPVWPVVVDSYGGQAYALLSVLEVFRSSPLPVATIVEGKAMSAGAILAALGTRGMRYVGPHSHLMVHGLQAGTWGQVPQIKADAEHLERLQEQVFALLDQHCERSAGYFRDKLRPREGADWYLKPAEAVSLGLADHIGVPRFAVRVDCTMTLELP